MGRTVDAITSAFPALHALCVGPGLGRHPLVFAAAERVIRAAVKSDLAVVLDADALFLLSLEEHRGLLDELRGYDRCVMTPNLMERRTRRAMSATDVIEEIGEVVGGMEEELERNTHQF